MCRKGRPGRVDRCLIHLIEALRHNYSIRVLASCCGHSRYPLTIVVLGGAGIYELLTGIPIPRARRFYRRDRKGFYYIPEISAARR